MIDSYAIAKALFDNAAIISSANSFVLIPSGESYTPNIKTAYVAEYVLYGDDNEVGLADTDSDLQYGIYQLTINTPLIDEGCRWIGLNMANIYAAGFPKGLELIFNNQMTRMKSASIRATDATETHFTHVLSLNYSVIG